MISYLMGRNEAILAAIGLLIAFAGTIVFTAIFCDRLPKDGGSSIYDCRVFVCSAEYGDDHLSDTGCCRNDYRIYG